MLTITTLSPRAIEIVAEGRFTDADVRPALARLEALLDEMPSIDILADVRGSPSIGLSAIAEEMKHLQRDLRPRARRPRPLLAPPPHRRPPTALRLPAGLGARRHCFFGPQRPYRCC